MIKEMLFMDLTHKKEQKEKYVSSSLMVCLRLGYEFITKSLMSLPYLL